MITAVFQHHLDFLGFAIAATLVAGAVVYLVAARRTDRPQAAFYGLWASSTVGPVFLTTWDGSGILTYQCTINPAVAEAFTTTQGQLNVLLFAPFGLFAVLATRRPLFSSAVGILFTATVETAQATMPFITRLCDTDDLAANSVGVLAGAAIGAVVCRRTDKGTPLTQTAVRRGTIAGTAALLLITVAWAAAIEPVRAVLPTATPTASPEQLRALNAALENAFGDAYIVDKANFHNNIEGPSSINAPLPGGFVELTWPDREKLTVHFTPTGQGGGTYAYKIPEASRPVSTAEQAQQVATLFAQRTAPWALHGSKVKVWPVDASTKSLGWVVEWRRWQGKLLMPMRLDILIEPSGRMTDLIARHVDDPELPQIDISESEAWERFESHHKLKPGMGKREEPIYLVERQGDKWRVHWRLAARQADSLLSATVDATTGDVRNASAVPASEGDLPLPGVEGSVGPEPGQ
ncbi:VanZ family protein [Streptomyces sp. NPDC055721]|uniref:VanZ family protein n=1 Tax=Streptomyces sp. NPDC127132 TaxID=3345374 RepID=UPI00362F1747